MDIHSFILTRPCLEEVDGYLATLRLQIEQPDLVISPTYEEITIDVIGPLETYRKRLLTGREVPPPSKLERAYDYHIKRKPRLRKGRGKPVPLTFREVPDGGN